MSTLSVANITDGTTTVGTEYVVNGSAKVFAQSDLAGTTVYGFNVSSSTDDGIGKRTFSFTSALADTTFSVVSTPLSSSGMTHSVSARTTTSASTDTDTNAGTAADRIVSISVHGDLA